MPEVDTEVGTAASPVFQSEAIDMHGCDTAAIGRVTARVLGELGSAMRAFPAFNSAHEGLAVLQEEVHELMLEVYAKQKDRDVEKLRKEAMQVAAMAMRFMIDICEGGNERK